MLSKAESILPLTAEEVQVLIPFHPTGEDNDIVDLYRRMLQTAPGVRATVALDPFWDGPIDRFAFINIQWPEALFRWLPPSAARLQRLEERLKGFREAGVRLVVTRHNAAPHRPKGREAFLEAYRIIYRQAHMVVHLGEASVTDFNQRHPGLNHLTHRVVPHPIYDHYPAAPTRSQARNNLGLPQDTFMITMPGSLRNPAEYLLALRLSHAIARDRDRPSILYLPRRIHPKKLNRTERILHGLFQQLPVSTQVVQGGSDFLSATEFVEAVAAADLVLIARKGNLNSGIVPVAMQCSRLVAGPDSGNIGPLLRQLGNPVFNPEKPDTRALRQAVTQALKQDVATHNGQYAHAHWKPATLAPALLEAIGLPQGQNSIV